MKILLRNIFNCPGRIAYNAACSGPTVGGWEVTPLSDLSCRQARRQRGSGVLERKDNGGEKRMGGILGLAVKKGSGVFKGEGHWRCSLSAS